MGKMKDKKLVKITKSLKKITYCASKIYIGKEFKEEYNRHKFENDDVTNLDIKTQEYIKKQCLKLIPGASFIGEEGSENNESEYCFIVDPIDGTFNFKRNILNFGTQIVLLKNEKPLVSVLYLPNTKQMFYANKFGAFENDKPISVSEETDLKATVVVLGDFVTNKNCFTKQQNIINILSASVKRIRILGSSCVDHCLIASGKVDAYIVCSNNQWDLLPGQFLVEKAGGKSICNKEKNIFISGNAKIVDKLASLILLV